MAQRAFANVLSATYMGVEEQIGSFFVARDYPGQMKDAVYSADCAINGRGIHNVSRDTFNPGDVVPRMGGTAENADCVLIRRSQQLFNDVAAEKAGCTSDQKSAHALTDLRWGGANTGRIHFSIPLVWIFTQ